MELQQIDLGHGASGRERSGSATVQAASGSVNEHVSTPTMASSARLGVDLASHGYSGPSRAELVGSANVRAVHAAEAPTRA
jgi:hypothetical protein